MANIPTEHEEQSAFFWWIAYQPAIRDLTFAIPNGGDRNVLVGKKLKAEGVRRGVPDIFIAHPVGKYHGLFIEMKRRKGGTLSKEQRAWIERLTGQGYRVEVCNGYEEAVGAVQRYWMIDMLESQLRENGYDGLCNTENECGCRIGDLMPCGEYCGECQPGYLHPRSGEYDFVILTVKPEGTDETQAVVETPEEV